MTRAVRLRILGWVEVTLSLGLAVYTLASLDVVRWPLRVLAAVAMLAGLKTGLADLHTADELKFGTFKLLIACDHEPDGVLYPDLTREQLWIVLAGLDPDHHTVWIDDKPLFNWRQR